MDETSSSLASSRAAVEALRRDETRAPAPFSSRATFTASAKSIDALERGLTRTPEREPPRRH